MSKKEEVISVTYDYLISYESSEQRERIISDLESGPSKGLEVSGADGSYSADTMGSGKYNCSKGFI